MRRDLFVDQPPHLSSNVLHWAPSQRAAGESVDRANVRYQEELIGELLAADVVLLGAPMCNWSAPFDPQGLDRLDPCARMTLREIDRLLTEHG